MYTQKQVVFAALRYLHSVQMHVESLQLRAAKLSDVIFVINLILLPFRQVLLLHRCAELQSVRLPLHTQLHLTQRYLLRH
jgi:hypothetical protein